MAESVLVSARVPQAKKDASKGVLASLGANTSDPVSYTQLTLPTN